MATPPQPVRGWPMFSLVLVLAALVIAAVLAVLILLTGASFETFSAVGWLFVVLALYLASLLVP